MPNEPEATVEVNLTGIVVPTDVVEQLDGALAALYGLIESAIALIESELPKGIEASVITVGLVKYFFILYHILNKVRFLSAIAFETKASAPS
jgi:hypothetical protein